MSVFTRLKIATTIENICNVQNQRVLVNDCIQAALEELCEEHDFPYYMQDTGVISTVATYETGTVDITKGLATIVGHSTAWTSALVGRKIRFANGNPFYRIKSVDSVVGITLEEVVQESTQTLITYTIYKDEYRLNADIRQYKTIRQAQNSITLLSMHPTRLDEMFPMPQSYADSFYEVMEGTKLDTYSTGTLSGNASTSVLTGVGTLWTSVEGLGRMNNITIGVNVYTIKSVDSDTQITIYETLGSAIAASNTYLITLDNLRVQLYQIPDSQKNYYYRYFRKPVPLVNDYDLPDMPSQWRRILVWGGLKYLFLQKGDANKFNIDAGVEWDKQLAKMGMKVGTFTPDRQYHKKSVDRFYRGTNDGLEKSSFSRQYSSPSY